MITASMVKELREKTGAGIMDCKKALNDTDGNMESALEALRKKGSSTAAKKAERVTAEGLVTAYITEDKKTGAIAEVSCETDFVAANKEFASLADNIAMQASKVNTEDIELFLNEKYIADESITIKDAATNLIAKLGENICVKRFKKFSTENGAVFGYIHNEGRIGALVKICCRSDNPLLLDIAKEIAMQVAAANPLFLERDNIDKDRLQEIRQKFIEEAHSKTNETKIVEKIVIGKLNKYYKENCLLEQPWIKDEDINISTYLNKASMEIGTDIKVTDFIRFERGEDAGK